MTLDKKKKKDTEPISSKQIQNWRKEKYDTRQQ